MKHLLLAASLVASLVTIGPTAGAATGAVLAGRVVNGTAGGGGTAGLEVTVAQLTSEGQETDRRSATSRTDGTFSIDGFDPSKAGHYVVATTYSGVTYSTVVDNTSQPMPAIELRIFETTSDDSVLRVTSDSITVVKGPGSDFEVLQLLRVRNDSDRTYIGDRTAEEVPVLRLPVATGGFEISPGEGITAGRLVTTDEGFGSSDPVQPGDSTISYAYKVRIPRGGWSLARLTPYPTDHIDLLAADDLVVNAPTFRFVEAKDLGGRNFRRYRTGPLPARSLIEANIDLPSSTSPALGWGVGVTLLLFLGIVVFAARRRRSAPPLSDREQLIEKIASLDLAFGAGTIPESEYRMTRARLKDELLVAAGAPHPNDVESSV